MRSTFTQWKYTADTWTLTLPTQPGFLQQTSPLRSSNRLEKEGIIHSGKKRQDAASVCTFTYLLQRYRCFMKPVSQQYPIQATMLLDWISSSIVPCSHHLLNMVWKRSNTAVCGLHRCTIIMAMTSDCDCPCQFCSSLLSGENLVKKIPSNH